MDRAAPPSIPRTGARWLIAAVALAAAGLTAAAEPSQPLNAHRVSVRYRLGAFSIDSVRALRTVLPPSDRLPGELGSISGFWFELRSADGTLRYRRVIGDPPRLYYEGPDSQPDPRTIERDEIVTTSRLITLVVPHLDDGDRLLFFGSPLLVGLQDLPAEELGRVTVQGIE